VAGRPPLLIAVAQPACIPYDVEANAIVHAATIRAAAARVVVFPELSLTGYELDAPPVQPADPRLAPIVAACADRGSIALVGAPIRDEHGPTGSGSDHIAMLAVDGRGVVVAYRKMWLGDVEARRFAAGPAPAVLDVDGWRLGLAICKDTGISKHAADTAALGIDAYVAGTVKGANEAALQHDRARRIATDHRVWVAVASFAGPTGGGYDETAARSAIWAPGGAVIADAGPDIGGVARATLD
jgi:predicted amidohydrolase